MISERPFDNDSSGLSESRIDPKTSLPVGTNRNGSAISISPAVLMIDFSPLKPPDARVSCVQLCTIVVDTTNQVDGYRSGLYVIRMAVMPNNYQRRISGPDRINELMSHDTHKNTDKPSHVVLNGALHTRVWTPSIPSRDREIGCLQDVKQATTLATDSEARPGMNAKIRVA
jgi:hypothetical protein